MNEDQKRNLLFQMKRVRRLEELSAELYTKEKIRGFLHLYIGEEAVATGVMAHLNEKDNVISTYREHAHALLKGISAKEIFSEMFGKKTGCSKGLGGSMHLFSKEKRFFGGGAIVGASIPHAVGIAMASVQLGEERRTVCFFGEGAMAEGVFYESLNMAALWRVPVLFCCENNLYAMGTALERSQSQTNLLKKVEAFNIQGSSVDGMSALETFEKTKYALSFIEREKRPYFLEFKTYRFKAHSMFDPELYRRKSEVLLWKEKCPIESLQKELTLSEMSLKEMDEKIEDEMQEAIIFAENSLEESKEEFIEAHHDTYL